MSAPSTDVVRRVFDEDGCHFIEVGPWAENPKIVELRTLEGEYSQDYWGAVRLPLTPAMAAELGRALIAAAGEVAA